MNNFVRKIQRWIRRDMIPQEVGESIIYKALTADKPVGFCGNCANLQQHEIDGMNTDWCPLHNCRVSGFDEGCKEWLSYEEYSAFMDIMAAAAEEEHIGELFMQWDREQREIDRKMKKGSVKV